ncbi:MAG TPA: hypothetical protein VMD75_04645 [Candidatus Binataceae bacterium]|nr:hypothetical protein [Candidatus Binataceae bacterium]
MAVVMERLFFPRFVRFSDHDQAARVVEPELDMRRMTNGQPSAIVGRMLEVLRWLTAPARSTAPPMRSIDRELWEASNDR